MGAAAAELGDVVRLRVADARIACASYRARGEYVPKRDVAREQELLLLGNGLRHFSVEYCGKYLPKAVLRMTVVEPLLARFGRGHRSEHEHAALRIEHRLDLMDDMCFVWCHVLPSSGG